MNYTPWYTKSCLNHLPTLCPQGSRFGPLQCVWVTQDVQLQARLNCLQDQSHLRLEHTAAAHASL